MKTLSFKTFLLLLLFLHFFINTICANTNSNVRITFKCYSIENCKGVTSYTIYSKNSFNCDLSFLALPAEDSKGNFSSYTIRINGVELARDIIFNQFGWQKAHTQDNAILLKQGENTVTFISKGRDLPQIKQLEIFDEKKEHTIENNTLSIINNSKINNSTTLKEVSQEIESNDILTEPVYRFGVAYNQAYSSTFLLPLYYTAGESASYYGPTINDPSFGRYESTIEYNVYFFYENPKLFSISDTSHNKYVFRSVNSLPYTGIYYLLVEAKTIGETGGVTLYVNNNTLYRYSIVSNCELPVYKEVPQGFIYVDDKTSPYNIFTINSRSCDNSHKADPYLWLKKKEIDSENFIVTAYNDNNAIQSDFNWENNARIRIPLDEGTSYKLSLASSQPIGFAKDTCDVYHSFWSTPLIASSEEYKLDFPLLKKEDLIESGRCTPNPYSSSYYNCISWSAGVNYTWLNPNQKDIEWFDKLYNNETVYDGITSFTRPANFLRYTREGASEENSVVDLWGKIINGDTVFTHASIRNDIDSNPHGYDWESKLGEAARVFHPRYTLSGSAYGKVIAHYRIADNQARSNNSPQIMIAKAIADGELVIESILLTSEEKESITKEIKNISNKELNTFERLYANWKHYVDQHSYESIIWHFRECAEYIELFKAIISTEKGEFLVYDKFSKGDFSTIVLIKDLAIRSNKTKEIWKYITETPTVHNIIRTPTTNVTLYIKAILQKNKNPEITETIRSNDNKFNVKSSPSQLTVEIELEQPAKCTIQIMNLDTNNITPLVSERLIGKGKYTHTCSVSPGLYIISYIYNGNINSKKIVVH
ncbi:DUF7689 domain-containing protein [Bacteroides sp.]